MLWWARNDETANWALKVKMGRGKSSARDMSLKLKAAEKLLLHGVDVRDVADELGFSSTRVFRNAFVKAVGERPVDWAVRHNRETLGRKRVRVAEALLLSTDKTMEDVAAAAGFARRAHLTKAFRNVHGVPPSTWKAQQLAVHKH